MINDEVMCISIIVYLFCILSESSISQLIILQEIWTLTFSDEGFKSSCIFHHDMGTEVIMNSVAQPNDPHTIAASIGHSCHVLRLEEGGEFVCRCVVYCNLCLVNLVT